MSEKIAYIEKYEQATTQAAEFFTNLSNTSELLQEQQVLNSNLEASLRQAEEELELSEQKNSQQLEEITRLSQDLERENRKRRQAEEQIKDLKKRCLELEEAAASNRSRTSSAEKQQRVPNEKLFWANCGRIGHKYSECPPENPRKIFCRRCFLPNAKCGDGHICRKAKYGRYEHYKKRTVLFF